VPMVAALVDEVAMPMAELFTTLAMVILGLQIAPSLEIVPAVDGEELVDRGLTATIINISAARIAVIPDRSAVIDIVTSIAPGL